MNIIEFAEMLDGNEYMEEMTVAQEEKAKELGFVVVFGGSDDLMELRGAIYGEIDCYDGGSGYIIDGDIYPHKVKNASVLTAHWCAQEGISWTYDIVDSKGNKPEVAEFSIMELGDIYCKGIVFRADAL